MTRFLPYLLLMLLPSLCYGQSPNTNKTKQELSSPRMFHISTSSHTDSTKPWTLALDGMWNMDSTELSVLSLVDSALYDNFPPTKDVEKIFPQKGGPGYLLLAVARQDSMSKLDFITNFYASLLETKDISLSYQRALDLVREKYGVIDFKSVLVVNQ